MTPTNQQNEQKRRICKIENCKNLVAHRGKKGHDRSVCQRHHRNNKKSL